MSNLHKKRAHQDSNEMHLKDEEFEQKFQNKSAESIYDDQEQVAAAAEGGSIENFLDNSQDYDNENDVDDDEGDEENEEANQNPEIQQNQNNGGLNGNYQKQSEKQMQDFEDDEDQPEEEFHSFTLERDVDPDELKDPNNYYEQLSLSFYNTHKKGDQITRKMIEQSLQQYLEEKRNANASGSQIGRQDSRLKSRGDNQDETIKKNLNVRVKVINSNVDQQKPKKNVFAAQLYNAGGEFEFDKNTTKDLNKFQSNEKLNEQNRAFNHNQFHVTNSIKSHRYFTKEGIEGEQSNQQKQINFAQLMQPNQPLGFQINQNSDYTKYTPNHKVIDMDSGFKGCVRQHKMKQNSQKEDEKLSTSQNHIYNRLSNKGVNLLNQIQIKKNSKEFAAPNFHANEDLQNDYLNINRIQTENSTPKGIHAHLFSRKHSGEEIKSFNRYNMGSRNNIIIQKHKEVFPAIKLEDDHIRYINTNENLQVQGKNQIKLVKQNDFFEFAAQLYNTNKSGNPQHIPNQMIKKLNIDKQAFSSNQLTKISNQLQNKLKINQNQKQTTSHLNIKKELISITSR